MIEEYTPTRSHSKPSFNHNQSISDERYLDMMGEYTPTRSHIHNRGIGDEGYLVAIRQQLQSLGSLFHLLINLIFHLLNLDCRFNQT